MSSTYTVGKRAAAFRTPSGQIMYVLFEQTYESNVFPRTPRWSCIYLGPLPGALRSIFRHASSAEGGMLRNRSGNMTPESYIASWFNNLAEPVGYVDHPVRLQVSKEFHAAIGDPNCASVSAVLADHGREHQLQALTAGGIELNLFADAELLADLALRGGISPWRIITGTSCALSVPDPALGYSPKPAPHFELGTPAFLGVDAENLLMQRDDGSWFCAGWQYSVVGNYIANLSDAELAEPGSYKRRIAAYRAAAKHAPKVPAGAKIRIDKNVTLDKWQRDAIEEVCTRAKVATTDTSLEFEVDFSNRDLLWYACRLPQACATWIVPDGEKATTSNQVAALDFVS